MYRSVIVWNLPGSVNFPFVIDFDFDLDFALDGAKPTQISLFGVILRCVNLIGHVFTAKLVLESLGIDAGYSGGKPTHSQTTLERLTHFSLYKSV